MELDEVDPDLSLVQLEKQLRHEVQALEGRKEEQLKEVKQLRREDEALCTRMETEPYYVSIKVIPTQVQLEALRTHVKEMEVSRVISPHDNFFKEISLRKI